MEAKDVGNRIANKRKEKGMNQLQLAESLNVSNRTVSKWENGDGYPDITILPEISKILDISIDELLCGVKYEIGKSENDEPVLQKEESAVLKVISFGLVIFGAIIGIITEIAYHKYLAFGYFLERVLVLVVTPIIAVGVIMYCANNEKNHKSRNLFEKSNFLMTVISTAFPTFLFFRVSRWLYIWWGDGWYYIGMTTGDAVLLIYVIALIIGFIKLIRKKKRK